VVWSKSWGFFAARSEQHRRQIADYKSIVTHQRAVQLPYDQDSRVLWLRTVDILSFSTGLLHKLRSPFVLLTSAGD